MEGEKEGGWGVEGTEKGKGVWRRRRRAEGEKERKNSEEEGTRGMKRGKTQGQWSYSI